ncbi:MAG: heme A synthase [Leptospira sp.]|nr:heme A synthase [Leptospira sp.]
MKIFTKLFLLITVLIYINLFFGPLVRATDSGLACPDWPLCYGKFVPEYTFQIAMEVGHRYYSGSIGIFILIGAIIGFINPSLKRFRTLLLLSLFFLGTQVTLGALTVLKLLDPTTVNLHLLNAVILLILSLSIFTISHWMNRYNDYGKFSLSKLTTKRNAFLIFTFVITAYQLFMGGRVSSHYAGLACPDFPTCYGEWFPEMIGTIRYQMEHRWTGYLVAVSVFISLFLGIRFSYTRSSLFALKISANLIVIQIAIGAFNVLYRIPKLLTALHTITGVLLLAILYWVILMQGWLREEKGESHA